jgi:hypothetical protein
MRMRISEYSSARVPFVTTKLRKYLQEPGSGETSSFNCEEERILKKQSNDVFVFGDVRRTNVVLVLERNHIRMRIHPYSNSRVPCVTKLRKFLQEAEKQVPLLVKKRRNTRKNGQHTSALEYRAFSKLRKFL